MLSLSGYLAFQDRLGQSGASLAEGDFKNLPFGVKATGVIGSFNLSVSFLRETIRAISYDDFIPGFVANRTGPNDFDLERDLEFAVGFDYTIPIISVDTRTEYYYRGEGAKQKEDYNPLLLMSEVSPVLGTSYLFLYTSRL
jgi:hypothetical protein